MLTKLKIFLVFKFKIWTLETFHIKIFHIQKKSDRPCIFKNGNHKTRTKNHKKSQHWKKNVILRIFFCFTIWLPNHQENWKKSQKKNMTKIWIFFDHSKKRLFLNPFFLSKKNDSESLSKIIKFLNNYEKMPNIFFSAISSNFIAFFLQSLINTWIFVFFFSSERPNFDLQNFPSINFNNFEINSERKQNCQILQTIHKKNLKQTKKFFSQKKIKHLIFKKKFE